MTSLNIDAHSTHARALEIPAGNLERALHEYNDLNLEDANDEDIENFLLLHQKDWDILFLDAYADIDSKLDGLAIGITRVFIPLLSQKLPIEQGQLTHTQDIQVGLHKIAKLLIPNVAEGEPSLEKLDRFYASGATLTNHQRNWNAMIDHLDMTLGAYGSVLLKKLIGRTKARVSKNANDTSTQDVLFGPDPKQLH